MAKFEKKVQNQEDIADSTWANDLDNRIGASVDFLYDYTKALEPNKFVLLHEGSMSFGTTVTLSQPVNEFNFLGFGIEGSANIAIAPVTSYFNVLRASMTTPVTAGGVMTTCQFTYEMADKTKIRFDDLTTFQLPAMTFSKTQKINRIFGFK